MGDCYRFSQRGITALGEVDVSISTSENRLYSSITTIKYGFQKSVGISFQGALDSFVDFVGSGAVLSCVVA